MSLTTVHPPKVSLQGGVEIRSTHQRRLLPLVSISQTVNSGHRCAAQNLIPVSISEGGGSHEIGTLGAETGAFTVLFLHGRPPWEERVAAPHARWSQLAFSVTPGRAARTWRGGRRSRKTPDARPGVWKLRCGQTRRFTVTQDLHMEARYSWDV